MKTVVLSKKVVSEIDEMVRQYSKERTEFLNLARRVENDLIEKASLKGHIHSTKFREKDPEHFRDKLTRKALDAAAKNKTFPLSSKNVFSKIDDLAGVRLLHIYREQLRRIDPIIRQILAFHKYTFREKPKAFTWDVESAGFYKELGFHVETNPKFYTSVHYVVQPHFGNLGCEIQVRTLAEELWGEVSHTINYPHTSKSVGCREQLAVLARTASGCTRLVDSIFATKAEFDSLSQQKAAGG
jgi:putative GTP pyrophosphokinase